jgi:hypothetical protein
MGDNAVRQIVLAPGGDVDVRDAARSSPTLSR